MIRSSPESVEGQAALPGECRPRIGGIVGGSESMLAQIVVPEQWIGDNVVLGSDRKAIRLEGVGANFFTRDGACGDLIRRD